MFDCKPATDYAGVFVIEKGETVLDTSELGTYRRLVDEKYAEVAELLANLPAEALLWKPFEVSPWRGPAASFGWLIAHAISSTVYLLRRATWIAGHITWDAVDGDEGGDEFGPANLDPTYLSGRAARTHVIAQEILARLTPADLDRNRPHPRQPERLLVARYDLQHAIEHMSQHIGHAQVTRQMWEIERGTASE